MSSDVFHLECEGIGQCTVLGVRGLERMSGLPRWELDVLCPEALPDLRAIAGSPAELLLRDDLEGTRRRLDLIVTEIALTEEERLGHRYSVALSAPEQQLALRAGYRIFLDKAAHEIVLEVLREAGVPQDRVALRLAGQYAPRAQCTRYGEPEWSFIERLLAEEGISYWFDRAGEKGILVIGDSPGSHDGIEPPVTVPFHDESGMVHARSLSSFELTEELASDAVKIRDIDVRRPDVYLDGAAGDGALSWFEYPSFVPTEAASGQRAQVRLEQLRRLKIQARAACDCVRVQPGRILRVEGLADDAMNGAYLVVEVEHEYARPAPHAPDAVPYHQRISLVPHGGAPFRPAVPSGAPRVDGVESAVTTGPPGEEIHVDDLGRVKLRFLWDPSGIEDDRSSAWARCLQWPLGGAMLLPRVGWEVPVAYMDGSPDRPFVLGRLYDATAVVPYPLPGAAATTSLQSATSPGGGSTNEIRMGDGAGSQEMFVHASRDQSVSVGGSSTTTVGASETHDVGISLAAVVLASQQHSVGGSQSVDVGTAFSTAVKGAATLSVGGAEFLKAGANRTVAAKGAAAEVVGGAYALRCNQANMQVVGNFVQINGGSSLLSAGISVTESVAGARSELVGGSLTVVASGKYADTVTGMKRIQAGGAATESAGGAAAVAARIGKIKAGSASLTAGGAFVIKGADITIEASSLSAGALEVSGGALRGASGTTTVKASAVKHSGGGKLE